MVNKKKILNIILGVAIVFAVISLFSIFIEYINILNLKGNSVKDLVDFYGEDGMLLWQHLFNFTSIGFWLSLAGIILVVLKLCIKNKIFNYIANVVLCIIAVILIVLAVNSFINMWKTQSYASGYSYNYIAGGKYTFIKEMQGALCVLAAAFFTIDVSFVINDVYESRQELKDIEKNAQ